MVMMLVMLMLVMAVMMVVVKIWWHIPIMTKSHFGGNMSEFVKKANLCRSDKGKIDCDDQDADNFEHC